MPDSAVFDEEALLAAVDLVGRTGAKNFEIGYLNDEGEPAYAQHGPQWWAKAQYRGARIDVEDFARPDHAAHALALRLLTGSKCRCGRLVRLAGDDSAFAFMSADMADGSHWTAQEAADAGQCEWKRQGRRWEPSCPDQRPNRAQRRGRR